MGAEATTFTLERLHDTTTRVEIFGRWDGVRGRRFIRPTLSFPGGTRVLAELADKPWMPGEDGAWRVAFQMSPPPPSWVAGEPAELSVAPDLAVEFGARAQPGTVLAGRAAHGTPVDTLAAMLAAPEAEVAAPAGATAEAAPAPEPGEDEIDSLRSVLTEAREARERALAQVRSATAARDEALARREEAVRERDAALAERDRALAASEEAHALLARTLDPKPGRRE